jgi:hypothetical protein
MKTLIHHVQLEPSTPDALFTLVSSQPHVRHRLLSLNDDAVASRLVNQARDKASAVLSKLRERHVPPDTDQLAALEEHVFREALGRLVLAELDAPSSAFLPASPLALGARFDQVSAPSLSQFMTRGWAVQTGLFPNKPLALAELLNKDFARASRVGAVQTLPDDSLHFRESPVVARERFPALHAVADRLACLPRELNLKLAAERFGEVTGQIEVFSRGAAVCVLPTQVMAVYMFGPLDAAATGAPLLTGGGNVDFQLDGFGLLRHGGWKLSKSGYCLLGVCFPERT